MTRTLAKLLLFIYPLTTSLGRVGQVAGFSQVRLVSLGLIALAVLALATGGTTQKVPRHAIWLTVASTVWIGYGAFFMTSGEGFKELLGVALMLWTMVAAMVLVTDRSFFRVFLWGWAFAWLCVTLPAIHEIRTGDHLPNYQSGASHDIRTRAVDIASYMDQPNLYAWFMGVAMLVMMVGWFMEHGWRRWLLAAAILATPVLVYPSNSRLLTAFVFAYAAVFVYLVKPSRTTIALYLTGFLSLVALLAISPSGPTSNSDLVRGRLYLNGFYMFWRSFGIGVGPANYNEQMAHQQAPLATFGAVNPHSGVIEILSQYGMLVFLLVAAMWAILVVRLFPSLWRDWPDPVHTAMRRVLLVLVATAPLLSFANSNWAKSSVAPAQMLVVALLAHLILQSRQPWLLTRPVRGAAGVHQPSLPVRARLLARATRPQQHHAGADPHERQIDV